MEKQIRDLNNELVKARAESSGAQQKLKEALAIADDISVLRGGKVAGHADFKSKVTALGGEVRLLDSKAFSEAAMQEVLRFVEAQAPSPARDRIRFILRFMEAVGLRSAELLSATLGDIHKEPEGWFMHVTGKGNADKAAVIAAVRARGFNPADDNEADALAILLWATETQGGVR